MTLDDLDLFTESTPANPAATARKCRRHDWSGEPILDVVGEPGIVLTRVTCARCGRPWDQTRARRGRNNRARGNAIEREVGKRLGLRRVGQYGGPDDLSGDMFSVQVKSGGAFPERLWSWLKAVPANASQTPLLVVTDAPGPGHRRRAVVVLDLDSWIQLHGEGT